MSSGESGESAKLQQHLGLLREQYVRLQEKYTALEQQHAILLASSDSNLEDSYVSKLLQFVGALYDKEKYSDLVVKLKHKEVRAHRFVLAARSDTWNVPSLADTDILEWQNIDEEVGESLLQWVYTDQISLVNNEDFILQLMKVAASFKLMPLVLRCETSLMTSVTVRNCVRLYTTADEINATTLRDHCSTLISAHWNDFTPEDFSHMTAPLLYTMFKSKTKYPLHAAVKLQREDVVFLYLIEYDAQLPSVLNECQPSTGAIPLELALIAQHSSIAATLLKHGADVKNTDNRGASLLHRAVARGDNFSGTFLIKNGAHVNTIRDDHQSPLHVLSSTHYIDEHVMKDMVLLAKLLLESGADPNLQDSQMKTALHYVIERNNRPLFNIIIQESKNLNLELRDTNNLPVLWYALMATTNFSESSFASVLIKHGASADTIIGQQNDSLLHRVAAAGLEEAGLFLTTQGVQPNCLNSSGESPLHASCTAGLSNLTNALLKIGANSNIQTYPPSPTRDRGGGHQDKSTVYRETPLHRAIRNTNDADVRAIIDFKELCENDPQTTGKLITPLLDLRDSDDLTPLGVAVGTSQLHVASFLLTVGAMIDALNTSGLSLLHLSIMVADVKLANFLLDNGASPNLRSQAGLSPLQLCIEYNVVDVVESLCEKGSDLNSTTSAHPDPILWLALSRDRRDIASVIVKFEVDTDAWGEGPDGCQQTLLHRAIDENLEEDASFLVRSGCDVNATRRPGPGGGGGDVAQDLQTPLHMCCSWGLANTTATLLLHNAKVNTKDIDGKTPLHHAIENGHSEIITLLLEHKSIDLTIKDKYGTTHFAAAMARKNNKAAQAILNREPKAAEQYDHKGFNFLHVAIQKKDIESVLFLLGIHVDMHTRTQDEQSLTPLHLATLSGSDLIVRNLLLAGAAINEVTPQKQSPLHLAALNDHPHIASVFLQNNIDFDSVDNGLNNALHVAIKEGHLNVVKVLLTESQINAGSVNMRGQNPLHVLANYPKDNAAAIAELFLEAMPEYPVNKADVEGNTAFLLAYMKGAGQLCRVLIKHGTCLGDMNKNGVNIFNYQVPTKTLLFRLLDSLSNEPPWSEGDLCMECGTKFGIATRRHHCRHCGRLLCSKCSDKDVPILKFSLNKPVRVCQICFSVLTLGVAALS